VIARWRRAGLLIPTLMTLVMLPVLIALGNWQLQRMYWKEDLIARLAAARTAEPVSLKEVWDRFRRGENIEYARVRVAGTFDHGSERHLYAPTTQSQGWDVFTVLDAPEGRIYVNRGWVPDKHKDPATRVEGQIAGPATVTGLARLPEATGAFTAQDDPKGNRWYHRDPVEFFWNGKTPDQRRIIEATARFKMVAPFSIDAEPEPANPGGWPKASATEIRVANRHLEYVVTWWGLAATLVVVFFLFARKRLRDTP
jgi:surfeit locus 1 family protein